MRARSSLPEPKAKILPQFFNFFEIIFLQFFKFTLYNSTDQLLYCLGWLIFINFITFSFSLPRIAFCAKLRNNYIVWMKSCLLLFCHTVWVSSSDVGKISRFTSTYFSSVLQAALLQQIQKLWVGWCLSVFFLSGTGLQRVKTKKTIGRVFLIGSEFRGKILLFAGFLWYICTVQLTALFRRTVDWKSVRESLPFE